jgi:hypothetical protein
MASVHVVLRHGLGSICLLTALVLAGVPWGPIAGADATHTYGIFGQGQVQQASDPAELQLEHDIGISMHVLELNWSLLQPDSSSSWNAAAIDAYQQKIDTFTSVSSDTDIVLDLGLQYPPPWVVAQDPLTDQYGMTWRDRHVGHGDIPNLFWSASVQSWTREYLAKVFRSLDFHGRLWGVRAGWYYGENVFPAYRPSPQQAVSFWAYDRTAQLASPVPGWRPGDPSPNGQAQAFYEWYVDSIAKAFLFIKSAIRDDGFLGHVSPVTPGGSIWHQFLPDIYKANLAPAGWDYLGTGDNWERLFPAFASSDPTTLFWCSSMGPDGSNDSAPDPWLWSSIHQLSFLAQAQGLPIIGENPGKNSAADMSWDFQAVSNYGLAGIMWIRESDIPGVSAYDGNCPTCATLGDYGRLLSKWAP